MLEKGGSIEKEDDLNDNLNDDLLANENNNLFDDGMGFGYGGSSPISKEAGLLKELTNFDPSIQSRIRNWLGLEWDDKQQTYVKLYRPVISAEGARWAIGVLQTYQAKHNIITNIGRDEMKYFHLDIIELVWMVFPTIDEFQVRSTADWYRLCTELEHCSLLVLAGAGDGKYTKFLGESVSRHENVNLTPQGPPRGNEPKGIIAKLRRKLFGG